MSDITNEDLEELGPEFLALAIGLGKLARAIYVEGPDVRHHRNVMARHRQEWPTLWDAIDDLLAAARQGVATHASQANSVLDR